MRLYVPTNGDQLRLTAEWNFTLYDEEYGNRNQSLHERLEVAKVPRQHPWRSDTHYDYPKKAVVSLPVGTVLQVDRVYIRKFNASTTSVDDDYDSITFQVIEHPTWKREKKRKVLARFWVKLRDANTIEFEHASPPRWSNVEETDT